MRWRRGTSDSNNQNPKSKIQNKKSCLSAIAIGKFGIHHKEAFMKSLLAAFTLIMLVLTQTRAFADLPEPKAGPQNPNMEAGRKAIDAKDYKSAVGHLTKAVQELPNDADAHNMLGYSYRKTGNFDKSMEHYQRALKLDTNHRSAHEYLGELYLDLNQMGNAEKQLAALKKACPLLGKCEEYDDLKRAIDNHKAKAK
jgi:tetratricopeptide (TPR) repeat protein